MPGDPLAVFPAHFFLHLPHFLYAGNRVRGIVWMKQMRETNFINRRWVYPFQKSWFVELDSSLYRDCLLDRKNVSPTDNRLRRWRTTGPRFLYSYGRSGTEKKCPFPLSRGVPSIKVIMQRLCEHFPWTKFCVPSPERRCPRGEGVVYLLS